MYFEEFEVGQQFHLEPVQISKGESIEYAHRDDPQQIHIDENFAKQSIFGGIIASGFQTIGLIWSIKDCNDYFGKTDCWRN